MIRQVPATTNVSVANPTPARNASSVIEFRNVNSGSIPSGGSQESSSVTVCAETGVVMTSSRVRAETTVLPTLFFHQLSILGSWMVMRCCVSLTSVATDRRILVFIAVVYPGFFPGSRTVSQAWFQAWILGCTCLLDREVCKIVYLTG